MNNLFKLKFINISENELFNIGFDKTYINKGINKHKFLSIKISELNCAQANILKQTAISVGTDCAVHREVITGNVKISDCILSGSVNQLEQISQKLIKQPFKMPILSRQILYLLSNNLQPVTIRNKTFDWNSKTYIMGILNITPDSFSDGGKYFDLDGAIEHYKKLVNDGADIVDIGGESTRPYSQPIDVDEEIDRVIPVIKKIREFDSSTVLSIDTRNALTAGLAIDAGVDIINDVSALDWDVDMFEVVKTKQCPVILNHSKGTPDIMQNNPMYIDVVDEIYDYFCNKIKFLTENGIDFSNIIIDPGIGFGKTFQQNIEIIDRLIELKALGCPILVGHSRKSFVKDIINSDDNNELDIASAFLSQKLFNNKTNIIRVHNVAINKVMQKMEELFF